MKGIILAGGAGSRLYPSTQVVNKHLLPVYNKPMIYYPVSILMLAGIREILIISTPLDLPNFRSLLGDGSQLGLSFSYVEQPEPKGIAQAFILGKEFVGKDSVCLILGDNIFYGYRLMETIQRGMTNEASATIFAYRVSDPERYGVVEFDSQGNVISIEEKPQKPRSNYAITGLYFYDNYVLDIAANLEPSVRGELEITDVNRVYLKQGKLRVEVFTRGVAWFDAGTHESLLDAGNFVESIENREGLKIACLEEIGYRMGYLSDEQVVYLAKNMQNNDYGQYLLEIIEEEQKSRGEGY